MYVSTFHSIVSYLHVTCDTIWEIEFVHSGNCFWIHQTTLVAANHNITMSTFLSVCLPYCLPVCCTWPYTCLLISVPDPLLLHLSLCLSLYLALYLSTCLYACLSTWPSTCLLLSLFEPLTAWLHTWMSTCLSVSNSLSTTLSTLLSFAISKTYPRQCHRFFWKM